MFNLTNTKEQLNKVLNKVSLGVLGSFAAIVPQTAEAQDRQIEEVVVPPDGNEPLPSPLHVPGTLSI